MVRNRDLNVVDWTARQFFALVSLPSIWYVHPYSTVAWVKESWSSGNWLKSVGIVTHDDCPDDKGSIFGRGRNLSFAHGGLANSAFPEVKTTGS
jgi:hypothetical protein